MPTGDPLEQQVPGIDGADIRTVIEEFGRLLSIFSAQLAESLQEADRECMAVGVSFNDLAAASARIEAVACPEPQQSLLRAECARIGESVGAAVVALQYHDRLAQRVGHIQAGLNHLQSILMHESQHSYEDWLRLLQNVERSYRLDWHRLARAAPENHGAAADAVGNSSVELF
jgi:hypothetical protein